MPAGNSLGHDAVDASLRPCSLAERPRDVSTGDGFCHIGGVRNERERCTRNKVSNSGPSGVAGVPSMRQSVPPFYSSSDRANLFIPVFAETANPVVHIETHSNIRTREMAAIQCLTTRGPLICLQGSVRS